MRVKVTQALAAGCVSLAALSVPALSRPLPNGAESAVPRPLPRPKLEARSAVRPKPVVQRPLAAERARPADAVGLSARTKPLATPDLVAEARKYMGTNPTARTKLWCATFMNMVLAKLGYAGTNSDAAKSFAYYGRRVSEPRVGAIAVLTRGKRGGHVGVVSGVDANGNPVIISGNHNKRVGEAVYARSRVIAYVMPTERHVVPTRVAGPASRPSTEAGIESPIHELLAAIEAEQVRMERPMPSAQTAQQRQHQHQPQQAQPQPRPQQAQPQARPLQTQLAAPAAPHRVVQQSAEPAPAQPQGAALSTVSNPFAELMSHIERAPAATPSRTETQRPRGRVAAAETGRGIR